MAAPSYITGSTPEYIDSRDLIEWADYNRDTIEGDDERETLAAIDALADEGIEDWEYGAQFVRDDEFVEHAMQLADDIGVIDDTAEWPLTYIDWNKAAEALQGDYSSVEYLGVTYWVR